mgnify:CR=1 FL=1
MTTFLDSRQAIIDRLEQEEELQEADIHRPVEADTDKVGNKMRT